MTPQTVLLLAPHIDDVELGCGATVAKWRERGDVLHYASFSDCARSLPPGMAAETLPQENARALAALGVQHTHHFSFPVREFPSQRQAILEVLVKLRRELRPSRVLLPASVDIHQDHATLHREAVRAFKHSSLLGYEMPWNQLSFAGRYLSIVEEHHFEAKLAALAHYHSQQHRPYFEPELLRGLARVRGLQCGAALAEAFEVLRVVDR